MVQTKASLTTKNRCSDMGGAGTCDKSACLSAVVTMVGRGSNSGC